MMYPAFRAVALGLILSLGGGGCALTSKGEAISPRYFSLEPAAVAEEPAAAADAVALELRLGQVEAALYLEERVSYRVRGSELAYYDDRRWTEAPEQYLRRALARELFERRHIRRVVSGRGATLDIELTAFEELRGPPAGVRLALSYTLHEDGQASLEHSLIVERPLSSTHEADPARQVAAALALALSAAVSEVSDEVVRNLHAPTPTPCVPQPSSSALSPGAAGETTPPARTLPPK